MTEAFIGQREALRGDHQADDELLAIGAMVPAVTALGFINGFGLALEIGAGQIVEDNVEVRTEKVFPFGGEV